MKLLAVDPGDKHVGMALFTYGPDEDGDEAADCLDAWETNPNDGIDYIAAGLLNYEFDTLVVERFNLYPDKAMAQTGSTMPTCEMIGCIKWAHRLDCRRRAGIVQLAGMQLESLGPRAKKGRAEWTTEIERNAAVDLVLQPAAIQDPTAGVLRRRGIKSVARQKAAEIKAAGGEGDHALSAELHGWHWIVRTYADG